MKLFMNCKKAAELIEKWFLQKLSLKEFLSLRIHLTMCRDCKRYQKYSNLIEQSVISKNDNVVPELHKLTDEEKEKMKIILLNYLDGTNNL